MNLKNMNTAALESVAVDRTMLATNLPDLADCTGIGLDPKTEIQNRFPLVTWLLGTELTRRVRSAIDAQGSCIVHKDPETGKWVIEIPRELWSLVPEASETQECCWQPFDFAKCEGNVPLNLLCLKDCDSIMDELVGKNVGFGVSIDGLASKGEKLNEIKRRVARLSMAFYTAHTVIQGLDNTYTNILKPFHGLMQVMENPAIATIDGTNILQAFASAWCRLSLMGQGVSIFAVNPVTYQGILAEVQPDMYGRYPDGWTRNGDTVTFHGISFLQDKLVPVDVEDQVGEIWGLTSSSVGLYLGTDLMPAEDYIRLSGDFEKTPEQGCAESCTYYYNFGTAMGNNANRLLRIVDVPLSGACASVIGDLEGLVNPQTLIPKA